jgi:hypothetical protein
MQKIFEEELLDLDKSLWFWIRKSQIRVIQKQDF